MKCPNPGFNVLHFKFRNSISKPIKVGTEIISEELPCNDNNFKRRKFYFKVRMLIDSIKNSPNAPKHFSVGDTVH